MERAARNMVGTSLLQCHEVTHHIHDLRRIENSVYRFLRYHLLLVYLIVFIYHLSLLFVHPFIHCLPHLFHSP